MRPLSLTMSVRDDVQTGCSTTGRTFTSGATCALGGAQTMSTTSTGQECPSTAISSPSSTRPRHQRETEVVAGEVVCVDGKPREPSVSMTTKIANEARGPAAPPHAPLDGRHDPANGRVRLAEQPPTLA